MADVGHQVTPKIGPMESVLDAVDCLDKRADALKARMDALSNKEIKELALLRQKLMEAKDTGKETKEIQDQINRLVAKREGKMWV